MEENFGAKIGVESNMKRERNFSFVSNFSQANEQFETKYMKKDAYEPVTPEIAKLEVNSQFM